MRRPCATHPPRTAHTPTGTAHTHSSLLLLLQNVRLKSNQLQTKRLIVPCLCTSLAGRSPSPVPRPSSSLLSLSPSTTVSAARRPSPSLSVVPVRLSLPVRPSLLTIRPHRFSPTAHFSRPLPSPFFTRTLQRILVSRV